LKLRVVVKGFVKLNNISDLFGFPYINNFFFLCSVDSQKRSMGLSASTAAERQKKENKQAQNRE